MEGIVVPRVLGLCSGRRTDSFRNLHQFEGGMISPQSPSSRLPAPVANGIHEKGHAYRDLHDCRHSSQSCGTCSRRCSDPCWVGVQEGRGGGGRERVGHVQDMGRVKILC